MITESYNSACEKLEVAAKHASSQNEERTLCNLRRVLEIAPAPLAVAWAAKIDRVISHVRAGHYAGAVIDVQQMWNRKHYSGDASESDNNEMEERI